MGNLAKLTHKFEPKTMVHYLFIAIRELDLAVFDM